MLVVDGTVAGVWEQAETLTVHPSGPLPAAVRRAVERVAPATSARNSPRPRHSGSVPPPRRPAKSVPAQNSTRPADTARSPATATTAATVERLARTDRPTTEWSPPNTAS